ncbi:protein phosphatase 2C domain-containing protein [Streptomyces sp. NPDC051018]|uniref:protein phosphatase 2C domain-containing protein n=1 Tax=Streptomyces sp. NPDC051018 TaxID=3365639 RepID=UPI0037AA770B
MDHLPGPLGHRPPPPGAHDPASPDRPPAQPQGDPPAPGRPRDEPGPRGDHRPLPQGGLRPPAPHWPDAGDDGLLEGLPQDIQQAIRPRHSAPPPEIPRGGPLHIGARPPSYPANPLGLPSVREADLLAATLPDTVLDGAEIGALTVRAVSVRGDSHRWNGECRQDAVGVSRLGPAPAPGAGRGDGTAQSGLLLLAVADGVGSAPLSHRGSSHAVRLLARYLDRVAEELAAALRNRDVATFTALADTAVANTAAELRNLTEGPGTAYATTLRALVVPLDPDVTARGFLAVGDGGLFRLRDRRWERLDAPGAPGADGVIDTRTAALPDAYSGVGAALLTPSEPGDVLILCTDGFSGPLAGERELRDRLAEQWGHSAAVPELSDFMWQVQTRVKSYDDDRSVVCLWEGVR